jgi:hypothetical protein
MTPALAASAGLLALAAWAGFDQAAAYGHTADGVRHRPDLAPGVAWFMAAWVLVTLGLVGTWLWLLGRIRS